MMVYYVEQTYRHFGTGEQWTRRLPKAYKTRRGAENAAQRLSWAACPDGPAGNTIIEQSSARVIAGGAA